MLRWRWRVLWKRRPCFLSWETRSIGSNGILWWCESLGFTAVFPLPLHVLWSNNGLTPSSSCINLGLFFFHPVRWRKLYKLRLNLFCILFISMLSRRTRVCALFHSRTAHWFRKGFFTFVEKQMCLLSKTFSNLGIFFENSSCSLVQQVSDDDAIYHTVMRSGEESKPDNDFVLLISDRRPSSGR